MRWARRAAPALGIYVLGRQHSGEVTGNWEMDGMLRYLSSAEGADALERFAWWFVPFVDTDGVAEGYYGKDQAHNDLNRAWHRNFPRRIELRAVQQDMRVWQQTTQARLMLDMHAPGHGERESYFPVGAGYAGCVSPGIARALRRAERALARLRLAGSDIFGEETGK